METPPEITFEHMNPSEEERAHVLDRVAKLERYCDHITTCSVAVGVEQREADTGDFYRARVRVHVPPNHEIVAEHAPSGVKRQVALRQAVNDAFDMAERQLRDLNDKQNRKRPVD